MKISVIVYGLLSAVGVVFGGFLLVCAVVWFQMSTGAGESPSTALWCGLIGTLLFLAGWIGLGLPIIGARTKRKLQA